VELLWAMIKAVRLFKNQKRKEVQFYV